MIFKIHSNLSQYNIYNLLIQSTLTVLSHMANQYFNKLSPGAVSDFSALYFIDILTPRFANQGIFYHLFM